MAIHSLTAVTRFARPVAESRHGELCVLLLFLIYLFIFNDCCQTNYFKISWTDLRHICRTGTCWMINLKLVFRSTN